MLLFALAKKSGPEHMVGDSNNWVMVLLSDRELFTGKILSRNWIAFISLFKVCHSLFTSVSKGSIYAISECVNILHFQSRGRCLLPVPWFSSSPRVPVRPEKNPKTCFHPAHPLWDAFPDQSLSWAEQRSLLVSAGPFRNFFWSLFSVIPLLTALLSSTQFPT